MAGGCCRNMQIEYIGQRAEIGETALLVAGDRGSNITGRTFVVDGGRLLP